MIGDLDYPPLIACNELMPGTDHLPQLRVPDLVADPILELAHP
jgi:hypothetical protein